MWSFKDAEMRLLEHQLSMAVSRGDHKEADRFGQAMDDLKEVRRKPAFHGTRALEKEFLENPNSDGFPITN